MTSCNHADSPDTLSVTDTFNLILKSSLCISGRLMEGDRLLEVNGTTVTGMSQNEVVAFLRAIPQSHSADILVSRHEVEDVPREITVSN